MLNPAASPGRPSLDLTVDVCIDPGLLAVAGALQALPALSVGDAAQFEEAGNHRPGLTPSGLVPRFVLGDGSTRSPKEPECEARSLHL